MKIATSTRVPLKFILFQKQAVNDDVRLASLRDDIVTHREKIL